MITYEDECVGCPTEIGCMGSACPSRNVKHLYCDECKDNVEKLYKYDGQEICESKSSNQSQGNDRPQASSDVFMSIPDNLEDEGLPFN